MFLPSRMPGIRPLLAMAALALTAGAALAHNVTEGDAGYVQEVSGFLPLPFIHPGA